MQMGSGSPDQVDTLSELCADFDLGAPTENKCGHVSH